MKWTQGKDLLNPPYSKTPAEIFEAATEGVIVPRIPCQPTLYPDPGEHNETRRLLPTHEFDKAYDEPGYLRFQRGWLKRWLSKTDGENQLAVIKIEIPPLSRRRDDIIPIARHFLSFFGRKYGKPFASPSPEVENLLINYNWKGNVRELKNVIERAVLIDKGPELTLAGLDIVKHGNAQTPLVPCNV